MKQVTLLFLIPYLSILSNCNNDLPPATMEETLTVGDYQFVAKSDTSKPSKQTSIMSLDSLVTFDK